ncbi:Glycosyl transferase group 1 [Parafrankia sp. Ea1.12]|uniref:glycosyltransferase n=1 Tax=Parafrankia sp. Ea1.12 TaxID=573499 RepID=UPI000DA4DDD8|nr:glycosyltransferase [Parafrankia sp. Ea1.12]SQD97053.1 Glycosyl transferase group 1 [Parafrankia sp. Ea1.12]
MSADDPPGQSERHPKVAVIASYLPNYRAALYRELLARTGPTYHLFGDTRIPIPGYTSIVLERGHRIRTRSFGPVHWQHGLVADALRRVRAARRGTEHDFDLLVMTGDWTYLSTWLIAALSRLGGPPVLLWTHGWRRRESGARLHVRLAFYRLAAGLLLYGEHGRRLAMEHGLDPHRLHVIYNSLDLDRQLAAAADTDDESSSRFVSDLFANPELPLVLSCFRITRERAVDEAIAALALLQGSGRGVNYLVIGDGPDLPRLQSIAKSYPEVQVVFYGACYDEGVIAAAHRRAVVTLAPRKIGLSALQSLAYGVPVVTCSGIEHHTPEFEILEDMVSARIFPVGDIPAMAESVLYWIDNPRRDGCVEDLRKRLFASYNPRRQADLIDKAVVGTLEHVHMAAPGTNLFRGQRPESLDRLEEMPREC